MTVESSARKLFPTLLIDTLDALNREPDQSSTRFHISIITGHSYAYIYYALRELLELGLIARFGERKYNRYYLTERGRIAIALHNARINIRNARARGPYRQEYARKGVVFHPYQ